MDIVAESNTGKDKGSIQEQYHIKPAQKRNIQREGRNNVRRKVFKKALGSARNYGRGNNYSSNTNNQRRSFRNNRRNPNTRRENPGEGNGSNTRLLIRNWTQSVSNNDIKSLFERVGPLKRCGINWNQLGDSSGTAEVEYLYSQDAYKALKKFDYFLLKQVPIRIEMKGNKGISKQTPKVNNGYISNRQQGFRDKLNKTRYNSSNPTGRRGRRYKNTFNNTNNNNSSNSNNQNYNNNNNQRNITNVNNRSRRGVNRQGYRQYKNYNNY